MSEVFEDVGVCRVCDGYLEPVLDLGTQCLGGQFPLPNEPDPPQAPLELVRCSRCGLAQLRHTVRPELMFNSYSYRSSITATMKDHLRQLALEAWEMLPHNWKVPRILDIGANDGALLRSLPLPCANKFGIDPSDVPPLFEDAIRVKGFFPQDMPVSLRDFDLIFTVACFYDADDPVAFATAVAERLSPSGLWCCEVANAAQMVRTGAWDGICSEHLLYLEAATFGEICCRAGMTVIRREINECNGGSIRFYAVKHTGVATIHKCQPAHALTTSEEWQNFSIRVRGSIAEIEAFLFCQEVGAVHLLGASTKANTWLQAAGATPAQIRVASDRDPRKVGRRLPGTGILIVSEEESRALKPDVYFVGPWHFSKEVTARERTFLKGGGRLVFPLPRLREIGFDGA